MSRHLATHLLLELFDVSPVVLDDLVVLRRALLAGAEAAGCTPLAVAEHKYVPQGASVVVLVAESHVSIHTWPEHGYAAVDIFTCGVTMAKHGIQPILEHLSPGRHRVEEVLRGALAEVGVHRERERRRQDGRPAEHPG